MSRETTRREFYNRDRRDARDRRDRDADFRRFDKHRTRRSSSRGRYEDKRRSRSRSPRRERDPRDLLDDNILSEISKLPEPGELWDSQFQDNSNLSVPPQTFTETMPNSNYQSSYQQQPSYSGVYDDFPSMAPLPPQNIPEWNTLSLPPPPQTAPSTFIPNMEDQIKKEAAIESEMRQQKAALSKQREEYIKKVSILKKELDTLKDQRNELRGDPKRSPSPDTKRFLKENTKLQLEIQNKLKTINNVVDMLNGIIGEEAADIPPAESDDDTGRSSKRRSRSPPSNSKKFNYVYYDPEMHWCRVCNEFPPTAKDYLNHLHSPAHHKMAAAHMEAPWHTVTGVNEGFPSFPSAPTKRTPIKGLQFFVPSTAWYCKLCDQFIGDLHCASAHLKSVVHSKNYSNFVDQNPHWETDWMSDRQKAVEKTRSNTKSKPAPTNEEKKEYTAHTITFSKDGFHSTTKKESEHAAVEEKKKKEKKKKSKRKRDSSSSSGSSSSSSNSEPAKKKKNKKRNKNEDEVLAECLSIINLERLSNNDRKLLDSIKHRMKGQNKQRKSEERSAKVREKNTAEGSKTRDAERRGAESRREDDRRKEERRRERDDERRRKDERRRDDNQDKAEAEEKKPEKKMPFIGKMPVFKSLTKTKVEEHKKEEQKKKEEDEEAAKKRREEMDAEIQKKVAEFKEKIAKAQLERAAPASLLGAPPLALPTELGAAMPPTFIAQPTPPAAPQPMPALPKDFQDALDIIFPTADGKKPEMSQELFSGIPGLGQGLPGFPLGLPNPFGMPGMMTPQHPPFNGQMMMGFDLNGSPLFTNRGGQLYDTHVPMMPNHNRQQNNNKNKKNFNQNYNKNQNFKNGNQNRNNNMSGKPPVQVKQEDKTAPAQVKKEPSSASKADLDDLAMLGIDASDVGAGL